MPIRTNDNRFQQKYLDKYRFMIKEYELVKLGKHSKFRFAKEFYQAHDTDPRNFLRYYNRFKQSGKEIDLLPGKRGPKYRTRRPIRFIENKVLEQRELGNSKFEIADVLKQKLGKFTPSASGIYNILKRYGKNRLTPKLKENKRKIIKERMGQLGHIDCHHLSKNVIRGQNRKLYLLCLLDDYSRLAWAEVNEDITALTTMFSTLRCISALRNQFGIEFEEIIADNGPEFGPAISKQKHNHPFERMLMEVGVKRRYTRPYRPQTNGKVERFWRTLQEDLIHETDFDSLDELKDELAQYLYYYNHERPHQGIGGKKPVEIGALNNKKINT
jgi:hypothetical protein